jgi:hypothetical protein
MSSWYLAIDFGTTNTAAAVVTDGSAVPVGFGPSQLSRMPSGVFLRPDGSLLVGLEAERQGALHPERYESAPKRSVGQATLMLGTREIPVVELVAAVLAAVAAEARRQRGGTPPAAVALTYPARWGTTRQSVLRDAATRAGLGDVMLVSEPEAAAAYFAKHDRVPIGRPIAVYDLGGGTLDVAVLVATSSGFRVVGSPGGLDPFGGKDVDDRLLSLVLRRAVDTTPAAEALISPPDVEWGARREALRHEVRRAKEDLAVSDPTELLLPGLASMTEITRADLRSAAGDDVDASVVEFLRVVRLAGVSVAQLAGIYLAGGSSRLPLVRESLTRHLPPETHRLVRTLNDPKVAVAQGAAEILYGRESAAAVQEVAGTILRADRHRTLTKYHGLAGVLAVVLAVVGGAVWLNFRDSNVVSGTVYDSQGEPMPDLELQITSGLSELGGKQIQTTTDAHGRYKGRLPRGSYKVDAYGTVAYEGLEVVVQLTPRKARSDVLDLPASGGAHLDLDFKTSGQRPDTTGVTAGDYFGGSVLISEPFVTDESVAPLWSLQEQLEVVFHFEPAGPRVDGTPSKAFDVTRTVGQLVSGSEVRGEGALLDDIPLGSYVLSATLQTLSGPIPLTLQDADFNVGDTAPVPLAVICEYLCGGIVTVPVGIDATYL